MPDENNDNTLPAVDDGFLEKIKNQFFDEYYPVMHFKEGVQFYSTQDLYQMFLSLYPNELAFTAAQVSQWMFAKGFQFIKMKELEYQWMLMPSTMI